MKGSLRRALLLGWWAAAAWGQVTVSPTTVSLGTFVQGQAAPSATVTVTAGEGWRATPGANWLSATPASGAASANPATVTLRIVAANLQPRETPQATTVVFASTLTGGAPAPSITVQVTVTFKPVLTVSRTAFNLNALPGQTPPAESFGITTNDPDNAAWTILPAVTTPRNGTWLEVSTRAGSGSLDTVIVLINTAGLAVGSYTATITVTPGSPASPMVLLVSLVITSGAPNVSLNSPYFAGGLNLAFAGPAPPPQNFTLLNTGGSQFSWSLAVSTATGGNWLLASPKSGTSAATVTVAVNGVGLAPGSYAGTITLSVPGAVVPSLAVGVSYTLSATTPIIAAAGVVNAASFLPGPIAPGQLLTIFGNNLANGISAATPAGNTLPTTLGVTTVTIGGFAAPLIFVSPTQINLQAPYEVIGPTAQVIVHLSGVASQAAVVNVEAASPAMFSVDGTGQGTAAVLRNSDFTLVTATNPARRGDIVAIFCTGLGQLEGGGVTGLLASAPAAAVMPVTVNFGTTAAPVRYAGLAVGFLGLYQINAVVPMVSGAGGTVAVTIRAGNAVSPALNTFVLSLR